MLCFDEDYYQTVIKEHSYNPLAFRPINFGLGALDKDLVRWKWLCHFGGDIFARGFLAGEKCVVTTGFGLSGTPHLGTVSQMLGAIALQEAGVKVQIVLGDLDAYNARLQDLHVVTERAAKYREFICRLGFDAEKGILRNQIDYPQALLTSFLIARYLVDEDFAQTEEDISTLYIKAGIYPGIEFPVKQAILLMVADFIELHKEYTHILVMLGIDEHRYVRLAREAARRMSLGCSIASLFSRMTRGLSGYPKMSKSLPGSAIVADMCADVIYRLILQEEDSSESPLGSAVFQMMCGTGQYTLAQLEYLYELCQHRGEDWAKAKANYAETVIELLSKWPK